MTLEEFVAEHPVDRDCVEAHKAAMVEELEQAKPKRKRKQRRAHKGYTNSRRTRATRGRGTR